MGTETKIFDKVVVTTINVASDGSLCNYGSGVVIYPSKGNFDTFENFKKFIYKNSDIFNHWSYSENERESWLDTMYNTFLKGKPSYELFILKEDSDLKAIDITIFAIPNEPIEEGSYIDVANIEL